MPYIDHFGEKSSEYLQFRPTYPDELYKYLSSIANKHNLAWDVGTGNGQAAVHLAEHFSQVIATDISQAQLDHAPKKVNVYYRCWPAERTDISENSVDLITAAQSLHWFDLPGFYREVQRVATPYAIVAAWSYSIGTINKRIDEQVLKLYSDILGDAYWPKERKFIDEEYKTLPFPFKKISSPTFKIENYISLPDLIGYLSTWSAVKEYQQMMDANPLNLVYTELVQAWGDPTKKLKITYPIHLLVGHL